MGGGDHKCALWGGEVREDVAKEGGWWKFQTQLKPGVGGDTQSMG